jgi:hypothetical protein
MFNGILPYLLLSTAGKRASKSSLNRPSPPAHCYLPMTGSDFPSRICLANSSAGTGMLK